MKNFKKLFAALLILSALIAVKPAFAITPTSTPPLKSASPTVNETVTEKVSSEINQLKDKIASRVSELNLVEKRAIIGTVTEVSTNKISLTGIDGDIKQVDVDEITKFSSVSAKGTFGLSDLTKGTKVSVLGLYNKQTKRILARFIRTSVDPVFLTGGISELDSKNFTFSILSEDQKKTNIDVQTPTKILESLKDNVLLKKIGFSRLSVGDRIFLVGYPDKKDSTLIVADRIILLTDAAKNPSISITAPSPTSIPTAAIRRVTQSPAITSTVKKPTPAISR